MIRLSLICASLLFCQQATASELSPWLGSDDQAPFQLDPNTMVAVTFAADPLHTGSTVAALCEPAGCALHPKAAKDETAANGTPQN